MAQWNTFLRHRFFSKAQTQNAFRGPKREQERVAFCFELLRERCVRRLLRHAAALSFATEYFYFISWSLGARPSDKCRRVFLAFGGKGRNIKSQHTHTRTNQPLCVSRHCLCGRGIILSHNALTNYKSSVSVCRPAKASQRGAPDTLRDVHLTP